MAKIQESKPKSSKTFERIFGNVQMGKLFSKVQSTVIRSGVELEKILRQVVPEDMHTTLQELADESISTSEKPALQVVFNPSRPDPDNPSKSIQADLLIVDNHSRRFLLVEVKEGYVFDTKKADGELSSLKSITSWLAQEFAYKTHYYLCSFYQDDLHQIVSGTKGRFTTDHVISGRGLCEKLGISFETILHIREQDQISNRAYFLQELLAIPEIKSEIVELLNEQND